MRRLAVFCAALLIGCSVASAGPENILMDPNKVRRMNAEEYAASIESTRDLNARDTGGNSRIPAVAKRVRRSNPSKGPLPPRPLWRRLDLPLCILVFSPVD